MKTNAYIDYLWEIIEEKHELQKKLYSLGAVEDYKKVIEEIQSILDRIKDLTDPS